MFAAPQFGVSSNRSQLRTGTDDLILYRPFRCTEAGKDHAALKFIREVNHVLPRVPSESSTKITEKSQRRLKSLRILPDLGGLRAVFMPGASASFILGTSKSIPHVVRIRGDFVSGLSSLNVPGCEKGFIYVDNEVGVDLDQLTCSRLTRCRISFAHASCLKRRL